MLHGLGTPRPIGPEPHTQNVCSSAPRRTCSILSLCPMGRGYWVITWKATSTTHHGYLSVVLLSKSTPLPKIWALNHHGVVDGCMGSTKHWFAEPTRIGQMIAMSPTDVALTGKHPHRHYIPLHLEILSMLHLSHQKSLEWIGGGGSEQRIALIYGSAERKSFPKAPKG